MKKTRRNLRQAQNKSDERFAKKVICQVIVSVLIYITVFVNSKLTNSFSVQVNEGIKYYLCTSADFNVIINQTKAYLDNFMNNRQSVPVNSDNTFESKEEN